VMSYEALSLHEFEALRECNLDSKGLAFNQIDLETALQIR
jgi:hypothetical protein